MRLGINVNPIQVSVTEAVDSGASVVRMPAWADARRTPEDSLNFYFRYGSDLQDQDVEPLWVFDRRSWYPAYPDWAELPGIYFQMGNEPDLSSPSSYTQTPAAFSADLQWAVDHLSAPYLVAGGLASGRPDYLVGVDLADVDAIAVHPYGQRPGSFPRPDWGFGEVATLIERYRNWDHPIWVTEFGGNQHDFADPHKRLVYIDRMVDHLEQVGVAVACLYCLSTVMHPDFGLTPAELNLFRVLAHKHRA